MNYLKKNGFVALAMAFTVGVALAAFSCVAGQALDEDAELGVLRSAATKGSGGVNGDTDFCNDPANLCTQGEGDCDGDGQCEGDLICGTDNGLAFAMPSSSWDVCVPAHCENGVQDGDETAVDAGGSCGAEVVCPAFVNGLPATCTTACPCPWGYGDCDSDAECQAGLVCGENNGDRFRMPHPTYDVCVADHCKNGVQDGDETGVDTGGSCDSSCESPPTGTPAYCTDLCLCYQGEGDCDADTNCAGDLVCGENNGLNFGMPHYTYDVCWPTHCENGLQDGDETGVDTGGSCGGAVTCSGSNGDADYCTSDCPCDLGEGDCDFTEDCNAGLICGTNNGLRWGMPSSSWDVCVASHCENGVQDGDETGVDSGGSCDPTEVCDNSVDDDFDTDIDCADTDCAWFHACGGTETDCTDSTDNDGDTNIDCADSDCDAQSCGAGCLCSGGAATENDCTDAADNDGDTNIDCADSDCDAQSCGAGCLCSGGAATENDCTDSTDNDGDGDIDCLDSDCLGDPACP